MPRAETPVLSPLRMSGKALVASADGQNSQSVICKYLDVLRPVNQYGYIRANQ